MIGTVPLIQWYRAASKGLEFYHPAKWCRYKREFFLENKIHKILWDFQIRKDHPISNGCSDIILIKISTEKNLLSTGFHCSSGPQSENDGKRNAEEIPESCQGSEKILDSNDTDSQSHWSSLQVPVMNWINWRLEQELIPSARILRRVLEIRGNLLLRLQRKIIIMSCWKKLTRVK